MGDQHLTGNRPHTGPQDLVCAGVRMGRIRYWDAMYLTRPMPTGAGDLYLTPEKGI